MEDDLGDAAAPHGHRHEDGGLGELGVGVVVAAAPPSRRTHRLVHSFTRSRGVTEGARSHHDGTPMRSEGTSAMHKPNNLLKADVTNELSWDPYLDSSRITVSANDGKVTLSGAVDTYYDSVLASEDAWTVGGVSTVANELLVGPVGEVLADVDVAAKCDAALAAERFVPEGAVIADVTDGWVTLSGQVRSHFQRRAAEFAVRRVDGVLGITNKIEITADPIPSDVADRIDNAFRRNAILDDAVIEVSNVDRTIYLDGTVGSWAARQAAEDVAWAAPGVAAVDDRLVVVA
jgi:osmotically-inducible protein OsmY